MDALRLRSATEVRDWMQHNPPPVPIGGTKVLTIEELEQLDESEPDSCGSPADSANQRLFGVEHSIYTVNGWMITTLRRVYQASSAEEALSEYLYGPSYHQSGRGVQCVGFIMREDWRYEMQEIEVYELAPDTDCFF